MGFTPADALHVLGKSQIGDATASIAGARILADLRGEKIEAFFFAKKNLLAIPSKAIPEVLKYR